MAVERKYNALSLKGTLNNVNVSVRLNKNDLKYLRKSELIEYIVSFFPPYDKMRQESVNLKLEINFLTRKCRLLEEQLQFYKHNYIARRNKNHKEQVSIDTSDKYNLKEDI